LQSWSRFLWKRCFGINAAASPYSGWQSVREKAFEKEKECTQDYYTPNQEMGA
jgi:hypothetical protein